MARMREIDGKREQEVTPAGVDALQLLGWELVDNDEKPAEDDGAGDDAEQPEEAPEGAEEDAEGAEQADKPASKRRAPAKKG